MCVCRPFMGRPGMQGGPGMGPFGDEDQGPFREVDDGAGGMGSLAMGMDVDIPTTSTSTDRREAERQRGRDSRYMIVHKDTLYFRLCHDTIQG